MEFSQAPFYTIASIDKNAITFKRGDKTATRSHRDIDHKHTDVYLLTKNGFVAFSSKKSIFYTKVHVIDNIATHLYTYHDHVICLENDKFYEKLDYDEIKGNWLIKNMDNYKIIRHLGCCHKCSDNHEILITMPAVRCYNDNYLYTLGKSSKYIKYENAKLSVHNYNNVVYDWKKFNELKKIKIISFNKDTVTTNIGDYNLELFEKIDFNAEYIETVDGLATIINGMLTFKNKHIRADSITYVTSIDNKIAHIYTETHNLCCKTDNLDVTSHKTINNEHFPWTLTSNKKFRHIMQCIYCAGSSYVYSNIQNVAGYSDCQIIFNHVVNQEVVKSTISLVNTQKGLDLMMNDYDEHENTKITETTEKQQELPPNAFRDSTGKIWYTHACGTVAITTGTAMETTENTEISKEDDKEKARKAIEIVEKSDADETTETPKEDDKEKARKAIEIVEKSDADETLKQEIIKSIEEVFKC